MIEKWTILKSERLISNRWIGVRHDQCRIADDTVIEYYVVEKPDYVSIVPITDDGQVVLVRQYKHGCGEIVYELPAGYLEPGEDPLECAQRELREETGYSAETIIPLGRLYTAPSVMTCSAYFFLAQGVRPAGLQTLDEDERIDVEAMPLQTLLEAAANNEILNDVSSLAALYLAQSKWKGGDDYEAPSPR
jgi:8-oxo-dGTP pyrophosphatase MutT (NUDIX family)